MAVMPVPPAELGKHGLALWRAMTGKYEFDPGELSLLADMCIAEDNVRRLAPLAKKSPAAGRELRGWAGLKIRDHAALKLPADAAPAAPRPLKAAGKVGL
jgi:hypothetical protein